MNNLKARILSALIALGVVILVTWKWQNQGMIWFSSLCVLLVIREFARIVYTGGLRYAFSIGCVLVFFSCVFLPENALSVFAVIALVLQSWVLGRSARGSRIQDVYVLQGLSALGLIYCSVLPSFCVKLLQLPNGLELFYTFLIVTFMGDVSAYFVGLKFGKTKLLESVSPKKTVEGALGGLAGSLLASVACGLALGLPLYIIVPLAGFTGALGQIGDLFESLIKRVAQVKDSGSIMPGHGGMWDRLDGLFFAAPFFYFVVSNLRTYLDL